METASLEKRLVVTVVGLSVLGVGLAVAWPGARASPPPRSRHLAPRPLARATPRRPPARAHRPHRRRRASSGATATHGRVVRVPFFSPAVGSEKYYLIYLPPGYRREAARGQRFPVLYLLHGGPSYPDTYVRAAAVPETFDRLLARRQARPTLIVMPYGRVHHGPPDTEWSNTALGRYEDLVLDAVRAVDARWPTVRTRGARMLAGFSTGGYAAANIALHHPATFAGFESWSGFFVEDRTEAFRHEPEGNLLRNSPALYVSSLRAELRRYPMRAFAYQGREDHERTALAAFTARFRAAGGRITEALYPGKHSFRLWRWRMRSMLNFASRILHAGAA